MGIELTPRPSREVARCVATHGTTTGTISPASAAARRSSIGNGKSATKVHSARSNVSSTSRGKSSAPIARNRWPTWDSTLRHLAERPLKLGRYLKFSHRTDSSSRVADVTLVLHRRVHCVKSRNGSNSIGTNQRVRDNLPRSIDKPRHGARTGNRK